LNNLAKFSHVAAYSAGRRYFMNRRR